MNRVGIFIAMMVICLGTFTRGTPTNPDYQVPDELFRVVGEADFNKTIIEWDHKELKFYPDGVNLRLFMSNETFCVTHNGPADKAATEFIRALRAASEKFQFYILTHEEVLIIEQKMKRLRELESK